MSEPAPLSPPLNATLAPKFWEMGEYAFEDFCRALWLEEGVMCQKYGERGQSQEGIDLITYNQPVNGKSVAQCKCQSKYTGGDLKKAANKFFKHLEHWKKQKVKVFRLYVACSCGNKSVQTEYAKQRERFEAEGIDFALHDDALLVRAARPYPAIVAQYCTDAWVANICGGGALELAPAAVWGAAFKLSKGGIIFAQWEADRDAHLESIREKYRKGQREQAYDELRALNASRTWENLTPDLRGKTLRLLAALELDRAGDVAAAGNWIAAARKEDTKGNFQVADALLAYYERGTEAGLAAVAEPKTVEAWNLQLALWLARGQSEDVLAELDAGTFPRSLESSRLRALALLFQRRVVEALTEIDGAILTAPGWSALRETQAVIYYASAISPEFHTWDHLAWPVPADRAYLQSDDASLGRLREAGVQFGLLLDETPLGAPNRPDLETWKAGALASHPDTQEEATDFIQGLITACPDHYRAVIWATERGYAFEHEPVRAALGTLAVTGGAPHDAIIAAVNLAALDGDYDAARDLLERAKGRFTNEGGGFLWRFMSVQVFAGLADRGSAEGLIEQEPDPANRMRLRAVCERSFGRHTRDAGATVNALVSIYEETRKGGDLLEAMGAKLRAGAFGWLLEHGKELLDQIRTGGALRLVLSAAERAQDPELCLTLLEENIDVFRSKRLPADLMRLEVRCLRMTGRLVEAARRATALVADDGSPQNALEQIDAQIMLGDLAGVTVTARLLVGADELPAEALLDACAMINLRDRVLATNLWEEAVRRKPLSNREVLKAVSLGYRLGLGERLAELMREVQRMAATGRSGVRAVQIEEGLRMHRQRQEQLLQLSREYDAGNVPVHAFTQAGYQLAAFYHDILTETARAASPLREPALLARHGSREFDPNPILRPGQMVVDATALLLAEHIGILELVERHFGPLRISGWLPASLNEQLQGVQPHQPEVDADREQALQLVKDQVIEVFRPLWPPCQRSDELGQKMGPDWCGALERVKAADGVLVDFFPLTANVGANFGEREIVVLPSEETRRVVPVGQLLQAARIAQVLTPEDLERCIKELGAEAAIEADPPLELPRGRLVFLDGIMAGQLARGGVLVALSRHCRLEIPQAVMYLLESEVAGARRKRDLAFWLQALLDRVSRGLKEDRYCSFTKPLEPSVRDIAQDADLRSLHDVLQQVGEEDTVVWCDDRHVNRNHTISASPVLSTMEVLCALRNVQALTDEQYFGKVLDLRRANVRHLPVTTEELLYHLRAARVDGGTIEETPALATLRMSIAVALREKGKLQLPAQGEPFSRASGELCWVFDLQVAVTETLGELWKGGEPAVAAARSQWLIDSLRSDVTTLVDLYQPKPLSQVGIGPYLADVVDLMSAGGVLSPNVSEGAEKSPCAVYFDWWYATVVRPVLTANPEAKPLLGAEITQCLDPTPEKVAQLGIDRRDAARASGLIYANLPAAMRRFTSLSASVLAEFNIPDRQHTVTLAGHSFLPAEYWRAVAEAINGRESVMRTIDETFCTLHPGQRDEFGCCALTMTSEGEGTPVAVTTSADPLCRDDERERRRFLSMHPEYFDLLAAERDDAVIEIARLPDPAARAARLKERRRSSAENGFRALAAALRRPQAPSLLDFFPDDVEILPRHLRLDSAAVAADWSQVAENLLDDEGLNAATLRLGTLPRRLPDRLLQAWDALPTGEFEVAYDAFNAEAKTPVLRLHAFHLAAARASKEESHLPTAVEARDALMASGVNFTGFVLLFRWVFERLRQRAEATRWSCSTFLAVGWNFAARIHNSFLEGDVPAERVEGHARILLALLPALVETENRDLLLDAAEERNVSWPTFLARGLGDVLQALPEGVQIRLRPQTQLFEAALGSAYRRGAADAFSCLAAETSTRPNAMPSFLGGPWETPLLAVLPAEVVAGWTFYTPSLFADRCLQLVEGDAADCAAWHALWKGFGAAPMHGASAERVRRLLGSVDLTSLFVQHGQIALGAIRFCCAQARFDQDAQTLSQLESHLLQCASHCHLAHERREGVGIDTRVFHEVAGRFCEAAHLLHANGGKSGAAASFCELAAKMIQVCPAFGTIWRPSLGTNVFAMPFGSTEGTWNLLLSLRAAS